LRVVAVVWYNCDGLINFTNLFVKFPGPENFILATKSTILQILGIFGSFFVFGYLLDRINTATKGLYQKTIGWSGILLTAWIGTPVHELGHVIFALLFLKKINHISLFSPERETGNLGFVKYSYHKWNIFAQIGNFFVGAGPLISGVLVLALLFIAFVPDGTNLLSNLLFAKLDPKSVFSAMRAIVIALGKFASWHDPWFYLFTYLSFCVATYMNPSSADRRGMYLGFASLFFLIFALNLAALIAHQNLDTVVSYITGGSLIAVGLFVYALFISTIHFILATIILRPFVRKIS